MRSEPDSGWCLSGGCQSNASSTMLTIWFSIRNKATSMRLGCLVLISLGIEYRYNYLLLHYKIYNNSPLAYYTIRQRWQPVPGLPQYLKTPDNQVRWVTIFIYLKKNIFYVLLDRADTRINNLQWY